jgi:hypothetical protein
VRDDWTCSWFPDLKRVESVSERFEIWRAAYEPVLKSRSYLGIALVTQVIGQVVVTVPVARVARSRGAAGPLAEWVIPVLVALLACVVIVWLVRRRITRNVRRELHDRGLPTCVACGYDLTGNVSGRCPECGSPGAS